MFEPHVPLVGLLNQCHNKLKRSRRKVQFLHGVPFFILFLTSCSYQALLPSYQGNSVTQCELPRFYSISNSVPEYKRELIKIQIEYWNVALDHQVFVYVPGAVMQVRMEQKYDAIPDLIYARVGKTYSYGCPFFSEMILTNYLFEQTDIVFKNVLRHEAGHLLGLDHSPFVYDIMHSTIDKDTIEVYDASSFQIETLKKAYNLD